MKELILTVFILFISISSYGQKNYLDTSFGENEGYTIFSVDKSTWARNLVLLNDTIYTAIKDGSFHYHSFDLNGIPNPSFGIDGELDMNEGYGLSFNPRYLQTLRIANDSSKLFSFNSHSNATAILNSKAIATSLLLNGSLNLNFGTNGQLLNDNEAYGIRLIGTHITSNDDLYSIGASAGWTTLNFDHRINIRKFDKNGVLDSTFGINGLKTEAYDFDSLEIFSALVHNDDLYIKFSRKIDYTSYISKYDGMSFNLDSTFAVNGRLELKDFSPHYGLHNIFMIDLNGDIYVSGWNATDVNLKNELFLIRYRNGVLDTTFGNDGIVQFPVIPNTKSTTRSIAIKRYKDKIILLGTSYNWEAESYAKTLLVQFNLDGNLDTNFGCNGIIIDYSFESGIVPYDFICFDNSIITCGWCPNEVRPQNPCLVKYLTAPIQLVHSDTTYLCKGDSIQVGGDWIFSDTTIEQSFSSTYVCDSTVMLDVITLDNYESYDTLFACFGDTIQLFNDTYTFTQDVSLENTSQNGCDSISHYHLNFDQFIQSSEEIVVCAGDSIWLNNKWIVSDSVLESKFISQYGCDSIHYTFVNFLEASVSNIDSVIACNSYTWINGVTYYEDDTASIVLQNSFGCDSILGLHLTLNSISSEVFSSNNLLTAKEQGLNYQWLDCENGNSPIDGANNKSYKPLTSGSYAVELTDGNCTNTSECLEIRISNLKENINCSKIYPNPTLNDVFIDFETLSDYDLKVYSTIGKLIQTHDKINEEKFKFSLINVSAGMYFIEISKGNESKTCRILKLTE